MECMVYPTKGTGNIQRVYQSDIQCFIYSLLTFFKLTAINDPCLVEDLHGNMLSMVNIRFFLKIETQYNIIIITLHIRYGVRVSRLNRALKLWHRGLP